MKGANRENLKGGKKMTEGGTPPKIGGKTRAPKKGALFKGRPFSKEMHRRKGKKREGPQRKPARKWFGQEKSGQKGPTS